jgi:DNA polymerase IV
MERLGITNGADLRAHDPLWLQKHFGKSGDYYYWASRGIDHRPVNPNQIRKSIGSETTFAPDLVDRNTCLAELQKLTANVARYCAKSQTSGRTVTLKLRYADFKTVTRSRTLPNPVSTELAILETITHLLDGLVPLSKSVRLLGVTLSSLAKSDDDDAAGEGLLL